MFVHVPQVVLHEAIETAPDSTDFPSIHLANLCSPLNKMADRLLLTRSNKDFAGSAALRFTETWLSERTPRYTDLASVFTGQTASLSYRGSQKAVAEYAPPVISLGMRGRKYGSHYIWLLPFLIARHVMRARLILGSKKKTNKSHRKNIRVWVVQRSTRLHLAIVSNKTCWLHTCPNITKQSAYIYDCVISSLSTETITFQSCSDTPTSLPTSSQGARQGVRNKARTQVFWVMESSRVYHRRMRTLENGTKLKHGTHSRVKFWFPRRSSLHLIWLLVGCCGGASQMGWICGSGITLTTARSSKHTCWRATVLSSVANISHKECF